MASGAWWRGRPVLFNPSRTAEDDAHEQARDDAIRRRNDQLEQIAALELEFAGENRARNYAAALEDYVRSGRPEDLERMLAYVTPDG